MVYNLLYKMNYTLYIVFAIASGFMAGATGMFFFWWLYSKWHDKRLKKKIPAEHLADISINIKPTIDERGIKEDERRRIEKIRQFEKLRRTSIGESTINESNSFYTGKFENGERSGVSIKPTEFTRESRESVKPVERKSETFEWY